MRSLVLISVTFSISITGHSRNIMILIWIHLTQAPKCSFWFDSFQFDQFGPTFPEIFILRIVALWVTITDQVRVETVRLSFHWTVEVGTVSAGFAPVVRSLAGGLTLVGVKPPITVLYSYQFAC